MVPVVVPYGDSARRVEAFRAEPGRATLRGLQPFVVNVPAAALALLSGAGLVETVHDQVHRLRPDGGRQYDERFGLVTDAVLPLDPGRLIVGDLP
jgi:hypothetical protein